MPHANEFLSTLAMVLCVAAVTTVIFQWLKQPVVLGYLLAGVILGPNIPIPLEAEHHTTEALAELGVILLMFSLGIEFSLSKLLRVGPTAGFVAVLQCSLMMWLGYTLGLVFGWSWLTSLYTGAVIAISSTTIIVKAFEEQHVKGEFTHLVFGILIVEDLIAILMITILTSLSNGEDLTVLQFARTAGQLATFLIVLLVLGLLTVPRIMRGLVRLDRAETTVVASVGLAFGFALLALAFGYSVALGAFLAGALVAESGVEKIVEHLVQPVRDIFAAVFFVSVGMLIDLQQILELWPIVLAMTAVVVVGKVTSVAVGAFLVGQSVQSSVKAGMSLAQIGEFSFIIAGVGIATGATDKTLYSVAVAVSGITTLLTPWLIRSAEPTAAWVDRKLPRPLQTFAALYGSWIVRLSKSSGDTELARRRSLVRWLVVDAVLIGALIIGASIDGRRAANWVLDKLGLPADWATALVVAGAGALCLPFVIGLVRVARVLGFELALRAFPAAAREQLDLAAAPRRLLVVTLQLAILVLIGAPLVAITQPFVPPFRGAIVLVLLLLAIAVPFWRSATNLQGHTRAAAQVITESLSRQTRKGRAESEADELERVLVGLGSPVAIELPARSPAAGKTLAEIKLRGLTGATVLAIRRGNESVVVPSGHERLQAGDLVAIAGTDEAVNAARQLLESTT